ncbi:MAG: hypothetical protein CW338_05275 [Clostridiales bacterium]|nr:hypothetical protein [Clostridiales bacterium]
MEQKERNGMDKSDALRMMMEAKKDALQSDGARVEKQKAAGRLTARERINGLFDQGSFAEFDVLKKCGVITGFGTVQGRPAFCFAQDIADHGAAMCRMQGDKILNLLNKARTTGTPVIMLLDSNGILLSEGAAAMNAYAEVMSALTRLSGVCPLIACVLGRCCGTSALLSRIADITIQSDKALLEVKSLSVMQKGADKDKTEEDLFGADIMAAQGAVSLKAASEEEAFSLVGELLALLPSCNMEGAPAGEDDDLNRVIEGAADMNGKDLAAALSDFGKVLELGAAYGSMTHTILCRVGGRSCGIVAQDGGYLGAADMEKAARFVRFCDCYQLPVITLMDTDGIETPDSAAQAALMRAASQLLYAYAEATTVKMNVVLSSAVGMAYTVMGGGSIADVTYVWPGCSIAAVSGEVYERTVGGNDYDEKYGAVSAAKAGLADDCIDPADTRKMLICAMECMSAKRDVNLPRKHGNLPL